MTADNNGPSDARDVTVTDDLPAGLTYVGASPSQGSPCTEASGTVSCALGTLPDGAEATVTINVTVDASTTGTVTNTGDVSWTTTNQAPGNNNATTHTPVAPSADVAIVKTGAPNPVTAGNTLTYTLDVVNHGPSDAQDVTVSDPLPAQVTYQSLTSTAGTTCSEASGTVSCDLGTLAIYGTQTITIITTANSAGTDSFTNTATVSSSTTDPDHTNNTASFTSNELESADMVITKVGSPNPVVAGNHLTYTLEATNRGPSLATDVTVSDPLPAETTLASVTTSAGTCLSASTVSCSLGDLPAGETVTIVITVTVGADVPLFSRITNTATVDSTTPDPTTSNRTAVEHTDVVTEADLVLTKTATPAAVHAGDEVTYTLEAGNDGPSDARAAAVIDPLPPDVTFVSATPSSGSCTHEAGTVICQLGTLAAGATATITIVARVGPSTPDGTSISNTAAVSSPTPDPDLLNNVASARVTVDTSADVAITKVADPSPFVPGVAARYTLTATNHGPSDAHHVTVTDDLPAELTYVGASPSQGSPCTEVSGRVTCALGTLPAGAEARVTVNVTVDASTTGTVTNTATVDSSTHDPDPDNNTATIHTPVAPSADVAIVKTGAPNPVTAGNTLTYTLEVVNHGPSDAQDVTVGDFLPDEVTYNSSHTTAGTCTEASGTVTCDLGTLAASGTDTISIVTTTKPGTTTASFTNTATVSSSTTPDPDLSNNTSSFTSNESTSADVALTKVGSPNPVTAGDNLTYRLEATNNGPSVASSVTVSDPLPAGTTFVSVTPPACGDSAGTVSCSLGDLAAGQTVPIVVTVTVGASVPAGPLTNKATASSPTPDPTSSNNTATDVTDVATEADLVLTKTATPATVVAGNQVTYTLTAQNAGPSDAQDAAVTDELPSGATFVSAAPASADCTAVGQQVTCGLGTLAAGATAPAITIVARVQASTPPGTITNTATVSSVTPDPDPTNNSSSASTTVAASADVAITKSASPSSFVAGQPASYTLTATNNGPSDAQSVVVTDTLPSGLTFSAAVPSQGSPCTEAAATVTCNLGALSAGGKATVIINVTVNPSTSGTVTNTATVASPTPDPDLSNNTDTIVTPVTLTPVPPVVSADMAITKIGAPNPVFNGNALTYTLSVVNNGPSSAQAVTVSDPLPAEFAFGSVSTTIGTCTQSSGTVTCDLGTMAASAKATVTIVGTAHPGTPAVSFTNTATVSSTTPDPDLANNSASFTSDFFGADVAITKVGSPKPVTAGNNLSYTLKVSNDGPDTATDVTVSDPLPATTSFVSATTSAGACSHASGTVSCSLGDLAVGDTVTIVIVVTVGAGITAEELTNTATASSPTPDPNSSNNTATDTTEVVTSADLAVTKTATPATVHAGNNVTYTIKATNGGPSDARDVVVSDVLPASLAFVSAAPASANCTAAGGGPPSVTCHLGTLAAGATSTVTIVARVEPSTPPGTITNNAVVSSETPDPNPGNEHASATTNVDTSADVAITKSASPSPLLAGRPATYTLSVDNHGASDAKSVVVTDTLPGSVTFVAATPTHGGPCTSAAATVTCDLGTLRAGAAAKVYIHVTVKASTTGTVTNTATVDSTTHDPDLTNNSATVTTPVDPDADLAIIKTASPKPVVAGDMAKYALAVTNAAQQTLGRSP